MSKPAKYLYHTLTFLIIPIWKWVMEINLQPDNIPVNDGLFGGIVTFLFFILFMGINFLIHEKYLDKKRPNTMK